MSSSPNVNAALDKLKHVAGILFSNEAIDLIERVIEKDRNLTKENQQRLIEWFVKTYYLFAESEKNVRQLKGKSKW